MVVSDRQGPWRGWSAAAVQAADRPVTVALVVWISEGPVHEAGHETSTSFTTVALQHSFIARRQTTKFPAKCIVHTRDNVLTRENTKSVFY